MSKEWAQSKTGTWTLIIQNKGIGQVFPSTLKHPGYPWGVWVWHKEKDIPGKGHFYSAGIAKGYSDTRAQARDEVEDILEMIEPYE